MGHYFLLPNEIFTLGLNPGELSVYAYLIEEKRLIDTEPTKVKTKAGLVRNGNLRYTIRPIQEAMEYKLERDLVALPDPKRTRKKR